MHKTSGLTETEQATYEEYLEMRRAGYGRTQSAMIALRWASIAGHRLSTFDPKFVAWLSGGHVEVFRGRPRRVA